MTNQSQGKLNKIKKVKKWKEKNVYIKLPKSCQSFKMSTREYKKTRNSKIVQ